MTLKIEDYTRIPFPVKVVRVTEQNMSEVARWCSGEVHVVERHGTRTISQKYVKVDVFRPMNDRQTMAFVGDYVLKSQDSFKVYNETAFRASFQPKRHSRRRHKQNRQKPIAQQEG